MTQMLELANKDFKIPMINIFDNLKEITVIRSESMWKINTKMKTNN